MRLNKKLFYASNWYKTPLIKNYTFAVITLIVGLLLGMSKMLVPAWGYYYH
jgi:hypothetical protein